MIVSNSTPLINFAAIPPDTRPRSYEIWLGAWNPLTKEPASEKLRERIAR